MVGLKPAWKSQPLSWKLYSIILNMSQRRSGSLSAARDALCTRSEALFLIQDCTLMHNNADPERKPSGKAVLNPLTVDPPMA